ncbi:5211_t:CDS:2 [Racocetra fulgida]|uniref:5211_t:CDS:1 n=1 Tax=Racocetra fulgida TaxID=60492 RepID=A0A9N9CES7_9GLOM|nr:5211_t:CDS:2 [Racocetra fulgida]
MGQIDKFRRLYEEDLVILEEKRELKATIIDEYIEKFSAISSAHKLQIYNDLSKSLELQKLIEIQNLEKNNDGDENDEKIFSKQFVNIVFKKLYELQLTEDNLLLQ